MEYRLLNVDYIDFKNQLTEFSKVEISSSITNEEQLKQLENNINTWEDEVELYLEKHITPFPTIFVDIFSFYDVSVIDGYEFSHNNYSEYDKSSKILIHRFNSKKKNLLKVLDYASITNSLIGDKSIEFESIQDKIDFLLEKLKVVFNEKFYSISTIFDLNSIEYRFDEPKEIARILDKKEYINSLDIYSTSDDNVHLSIKGVSYIERKMKSKERKISNSELDKKLDDIVERLTNLGYGQEIIFDEIEELRNLQNKLSKKSWGQLLKSKLVDLALAEVINKEVANSIFEYLTNNHFKILQ